MRVLKRKLMIIMISMLIIGICLYAFGNLSFAEKWQPYQFRGDERYEYKVTWKQNGEKKEAIYALELKKTDQKTGEGEDIFEVTYINKGTLSREQLESGAFFGFWSLYGISLNILMLNPAYSFFFTQMDLKIGEKMNFYGAGTVKVIAKEKVGGREGFVCQLFQEDKLLVEWVIDPDLAMPLRSRVFEENKLQSQIELVKYSKI